VIFTDPQVAAVGYTLARAEEEGLNARAVEVSTQASAGASFYGRDDATGTVRLVVDEDEGVVIGATFTGPEVAEFLQAATIAVVGQVPLERLAHAVPAFPTRSELWLYLMEQLGLSGPCQRET
jgi:pyruvate/2-oxoglutarate dehydrogenase complex dihydrolipoamide dehydrogenase (E3) component